jgi:hypothetical protein
MLRLNTPADPADTVVAATLQCRDAFSRPYYWQHGAWTAIPLLAGRTSGYATSVSDRSAGDNDPLIGGSQHANGISTPFVAALGDPPVALTLLDDYTSSWAPFVSADGEHVVGDNRSDGGEAVTVRWNWVGSTWQGEQITDVSDNISQPSDDASVVAGNYWIWMEGDTDPQLLEQDTEAIDLSPDGGIAAGLKSICDGTDCLHYRIPLFWANDDGSWVSQALTPLASGYDCYAAGVGTLFNSRRVIVGHGRTEKDGVRRALAWIEETAGSETFGAPVSLASVGGRAKFWAEAHDVNGHGQVVGLARGNGRYEKVVLWQLPQD